MRPRVLAFASPPRPNSCSQEQKPVSVTRRQIQIFSLLRRSPKPAPPQHFARTSARPWSRCDPPCTSPFTSVSPRPATRNGRAPASAARGASTTSCARDDPTPLACVRSVRPRPRRAPPSEGPSPKPSRADTRAVREGVPEANSEFLLSRCAHGHRGGSRVRGSIPRCRAPEDVGRPWSGSDTGGLSTVARHRRATSPPEEAVSRTSFLPERPPTGRSTGALRRLAAGAGGDTSETERGGRRLGPRRFFPVPTWSSCPRQPQPSMKPMERQTAPRSSASRFP